MEAKVKNRVVFVTGGASGIGKSIVTLFCKNGADVIFCDIDEEKANLICGELNQYKCTFIKVDISDADGLEGALNTLLFEKGNIDVIINNAGISPFESLLDVTVEDFDKILNINLRSVFITAKILAKHRESKPDLNNYGRIINMASTRHLMSEPNSEAYAASKGGVVSLTHALAVSLAQYKVTVNCISPGWIETGDYSSLSLSDHSQHPSGRVGEPNDIARLCLFLCDPDNDFINGQNFVVDGGMTKKMIYQ